jgi:hypothetical protein
MEEEDESHVCTSECTQTTCAHAALRAFYAPDGAAWGGMIEGDDGNLRPLFPGGAPPGVSGVNAGRFATMAAMSGVSVDQLRHDMRQSTGRRASSKPAERASSHACGRCGKLAAQR